MSGVRASAATWEGKRKKKKKFLTVSDILKMLQQLPWDFFYLVPLYLAPGACKGALSAACMVQLRTFSNTYYHVNIKYHREISLSRYRRSASSFLVHAPSCQENKVLVVVDLDSVLPRTTPTQAAR